MSRFIIVHDYAFSNRVTFIRKRAIMSIAETLSGNAIIAYGDDIVVETSESFDVVIKLMEGGYDNT